MGTDSRWYSQRTAAAIRRLAGLLLLFTIFLAQIPAAARAQADSPSSGITTAAAAQPLQVVQIQEEAQAVKLVWPNPTVAIASASSALQQLPLIRYQGYELPMQLVTVVLQEPMISRESTGAATESANQVSAASSAATARLALQVAGTQPWLAAVEPAAPLQPAAIGWEGMADPTRVVEAVGLPTAPVFLLRQGMVDGQRVAVFALSPLYEEAGTVKLATAFSAQIADATLLDQSTQMQGATVHSPATGAAQTAPDQAEEAANLKPVNPLAAKQATKLVVSTAGMQEVTGAALAATGLNLATINPAQLYLTLNGTEVALEINGLGNGRLTSTSTIRFYAPTAGDRWGTESVYWLATKDGAGARMATRSVQPASATVRNSAWEYGLWQDNQLYDSRYAGYDQDHWFHQKLILGENNASALDVIQVNVEPKLPRVNGSATYTIAVTTNVRGIHTLRTLLNDSVQDITWSSTDTARFLKDWQQSFTSTVTSGALGVALLDVSAASSQSEITVLLDGIQWQQPVRLQLKQRGAEFTGVAGRWHYQWSELPTNYRLYDVTNAISPVLLTGATGSGFEDGPQVSHYLVAGPGTLHTPRVVAHDPVTFGTSGADAIYIAPTEFINALEPLLALRRDQGYRVAAVEVADIYAAWSYGHVSPQAIRSFLRFAHANWQPTPIAVTLVGDGTWDPRNYEGKNNNSYIPPYLADVDPWLVETACDNCYVQLDGDDPITGDGLFTMEMNIGRLPVKGAGELSDMVKKIVQYETATNLELWQSRTIFIADNYLRVQPDQSVVNDLAGDFAEYANQIVHLAPEAIRSDRIYYDPLPSVADPDGIESWRINDARAAHRAVIANLSAGAGVVSYNGHSNQWQWGVTDEVDPTLETNYLLGLYDPDGLTNQGKYFVSLSMTCLTGQFHKPALSGTALDERMLLNPKGGAVAVWGSTGLSVAYGHDLLQKGFFEKLWSTPTGSVKVGELLAAGYSKLRSEQGCCQDTLKTFMLMGDPLTTVRVRPEGVLGLYLPIINK